MKKLVFLLAVSFSASTGFASSWQQVGALNVPPCQGGCTVTLAVSPSGNTVVAGAHSNNILLFEKPATGWFNGLNPTTVLSCSDPHVFAIDESTFGLATDDSMVIVEAWAWVLDSVISGRGSVELQLLLVWQKPANGWGSQPSISQSFMLETGVNGEGWNSVAFDAQTIAVGAVQDNYSQGAVYVWNNPPTTNLPIAKLTASDGSFGDQLGWTISLSGNTITTGSCPLADNGLRAAVYIFEEPPEGWVSSTQTAELKYPGDATNGFGCYVASNGDTIASGVPAYNNHWGRIDIFAKPESGWSNSNVPTAQLMGNPSSTGTYFGSTVHFATDISGADTIVSSSPISFPSVESTTGEENIYYKPSSGWGGIPNQEPNDRIVFLDPDHFGLTGADGAGQNTVAFADCDYSFGCAGPIFVYQYK
jgi:hypothetical protein